MGARKYRGSALAALVAALLIAGSLAACGGEDATTTTAAPVTTAAPAASSTTAAPQDPVTIGLFMLGVNNPYADAMVAGAREAAGEMNATIEVFSADMDAAKQVAQMQDAIASKRFDAFVVAAVDGASVVPVTEEAIAAGIQVSAATFIIGSDVTTPEPQVAGMAGSSVVDARKNGEAMAELVVGASKGLDTARVIEIVGFAGFPPEVFRVGVAKEIIAAEPNIEIVAEGEGQYAADPAYTVTQNLLVANKDIDVIWTVGDQMAVGVERAVEEAGLTGTIKIIGDGGSQLGVDAVRAGRWYGTTNTLPHDDGYHATVIAIDAVRGSVLGTNLDSIGASGYPYALTKETLGDYEAQWAG